jgi:hypothetical protein
MLLRDGTRAHHPSEGTIFYQPVARAQSASWQCRLNSGAAYGVLCSPPDLTEETRQWHAYDNLDVFFSRLYRFASCAQLHSESLLLLQLLMFSVHIPRMSFRHAMLRMIASCRGNMCALQVLARERFCCYGYNKTGKPCSSGFHNSNDWILAAGGRFPWAQIRLLAT